MNGYVGIDIGTTNTKCLVIDGRGEIAHLYTEKTPKHMIDGMEFFDIARIDKLVDGFLQQAQSGYTVRSVCFSSIGESVVPLSGGKPLYDCPVWNVTAITSTQEQRKAMEPYCGFATTGFVPNGLCSLDKILWMREHISGCANAQYWLPVTAYEVYRKTGKAVWDYTQAARSYMFDVHRKSWIAPLLETFGLESPGELACMGTPIGESDGIVYAVGGHDHMVGLYGIETIFSDPRRTQPLFYDSMGTSAVLTMLSGTQRTQDYSGETTYNPTGGSILPGFADRSYIITRSFRMFGNLLAYVMGLGGKSPVAAEFDAMNDIIRKTNPDLGCLITCDGDFILGTTGTKEVDFLRLQLDTGLPELLHSLYLYLAVLTGFMQESLTRFIDASSPVPFVAGGGITGNTLFMRYLATACGTPIAVLPTTEISALGAVSAGIQGLGNIDMLNKLRGLKQKSTLYQPDENLEKQVRDAKERYRELAG